MVVNSPSGRTHAGVKPTVSKRVAITEDQKAHQRSLAKIKRLNLKLSKVKAISINMLNIAERNNEVASPQVADWAKKINAVLNGER